MANLKDTLVFGKLTATGDIVANRFITNSASTNILLADGTTLAQNTFLSADYATTITNWANRNYAFTDANNTFASTTVNTFAGTVVISNTTSAADTYLKEDGTALEQKEGASGALKVAGTTVLQGPLIAAGGIHLDGSTPSNDDMPYFLGIEAFAKGGKVKWVAKDSAKVGYATSAGSATIAASAATADSATTSSYPAGFNSNGGEITWGTLKTQNGDGSKTDYSLVTRWDSKQGGSVAFADGPNSNNTTKAQTSMQIDGYFYQNEGRNRVFDVSGGTINGAVKILAADPTDTQPALLKVLSTSNTSSSNGWTGRMMVGAKNLTFLMGTYHGMAGLGVHSWTDSSAGTGANWAPLYIQPDSNQPVFIGANGGGWLSNAATLKIEGSTTTTNGGKVTVGGTLKLVSPEFVYNSVDKCIDIKFN